MVADKYGVGTLLLLLLLYTTMDLNSWVLVSYVGKGGGGPLSLNYPVKSPLCFRTQAPKLLWPSLTKSLSSGLVFLLSTSIRGPRVLPTRWYNDRAVSLT